MVYLHETNRAEAEALVLQLLWESEARKIMIFQLLHDPKSLLNLLAPAHWIHGPARGLLVVTFCLLCILGLARGILA